MKYLLLIPVLFSCHHEKFPYTLTYFNGDVSISVKCDSAFKINKVSAVYYIQGKSDTVTANEFVFIEND